MKERSENKKRKIRLAGGGQMRDKIRGGRRLESAGKGREWEEIKEG